MTEIQRDRYGRPYVIPPGGGKAVPYTRATTVADTLDDRYNLELWKMRQVAAGLAQRPDLVAVASAKADDKKTMDEVCEKALEASKSGEKANLGTALHAFIETINRGGEPVGVPPELRADLDAYRKAMQGWDILAAEQFVVVDELKIAGTADIIGRRKTDTKGNILDVKSGSGAVTYGQTSVAMQLAIYSRGMAYDPETAERTPIAVDQHTAYVVHLPAGAGRCELYEVDLDAGWEAVQHAMWVRTWRKAKPIAGPITQMAGDSTPGYVGRIAACTSIEELYFIYHDEIARGANPSLIRPLCADRKRQLQTPAA